MPYKNPETKQQWEREHRERRNAQRRQRRLEMRSELTILKRTPDPIADQQSTGGWELLLGFAIGLGIVLLAAFAIRQCLRHQSCQRDAAKSRSTNDSI